MLCLTGCSTAIEVTDLTGDTGKEWDAVWVEGTTITPAGDTPYIGFKEQQIWGYTGCNRLTGTYALEKDRIDLSKIGSTMMLCPEDKYETLFMAGLNKAKSVKVTTDGLELKDADGQVVVRFRPRVLTAERLAGKWVLKNGKGLAPENVQSNEKPFLSFDVKEQRLSGFTGCNRIFGPIDTAAMVKEGKTDFSKLASTRMLCNDNGVERAFLDNMNKAVSIAIVGGDLVLSDKDGAELMRFTPDTEN